MKYHIADSERFRHIYEDEFDAELPRMVVASEDGNACVAVETLIRTDMWYVRPEVRGIQGARYIKGLIRYLFSIVPTGESVVVISNTKTKNKILEGLGFRPIEGTIYRLDR